MLNSHLLTPTEFAGANPSPSVAEKSDGPPRAQPLVAGPVPTELHDPHPEQSVRVALQKRSFGQIASIGWQLVRAHFQLARCQKRGRWVRVRGKVRVANEGYIALGDSVRFRAETALCELVAWPGGRIEIGAHTTINYGTSISAAGQVRIGRDCLVGTYVNIMDSNFHNLEDRSWNLEASSITIGDGVWLGNRCVIMPGVTIGSGAVVAACSLVTRDVPPKTMVLGVPARVVRHL